MDLIDAGDRATAGLAGFSEQDEWFERRQKHGRDAYNRNSTTAHTRMHLSGNYETT